MVKIGDKIFFGRGKQSKKKKRNSWRVRWVGPKGMQRFVVIVKPLNGQHKIMYLVIDCFDQVRTKEFQKVSKDLDTDEEWERLVDDYEVGRRTIGGKNRVDIMDIEGLNDFPDRGNDD